MLRTVRIQNLRALKDVTLELSPLTVLVGPNSCGKSSVLRAFNPERLSAEDFWRHEARPASISYLKPPTFTSWVECTAGGVWPSRPYAFQELRLDPAKIRPSSQLHAQSALAPDGSGLANVFFALTRSQQSDLARQFCRLVPTFADVDTQAVSQGHHELRFQDRWAESVWYRPSEVSDGSLLLLAYLLIDFQTPRPTLLAIEEPERSLHPYLLDQLVHVLRDLTSRGMQIILATHSAELLEYVTPAEVRFMTRDTADGSVSIETVSTDDPGWEEAWEAHQRSLGSVWLSGGVGGVPGI